MNFKPHTYQKEMIEYILTHPSCGLFVDMGLGKTVTTLTALQILRDDYLDIGKVLIVAPKRVAIDTWPSEIAKWDHVKDLRYSLIAGTKKERELAVKKEADIYITTRDLISWLVVYLAPEWPFDTLVLDELSSFKNHQAKRFKALRSVIGKTKRRIGLTGTPKPNTYMDLWSELYLLDRGERLGRMIGGYRRSYFRESLYGGYATYTIIPGKEKEIDRKISDICISMKAKDYLKQDDPLILDKVITLSPKDYKKYKDLERTYVLDLPDKEISAINAAALSGKLLQLANGAVYDDEKRATVIHDAKIETLQELMEEGDNILTFYSFQSDKERIKKKIPEAVVLEGKKEIDAWNRGNIRLLLAHPASAGHGLNLQAGGHIVCWFGLPWSLELYQQGNARLARQGQKEPVIIYRLIAKGTLDEEVARVLTEKRKSQDALLEALKKRREAYL